MEHVGDGSMVHHGPNHPKSSKRRRRSPRCGAWWRVCVAPEGEPGVSPGFGWENGPQMMGRFWNQSCWFWGDMLENLSCRLHARYWSTFELIWDFGGELLANIPNRIWVMGIEFSQLDRKIYRNSPHLIVKSWFPVDFPIHQSIDCYFSHSRYPEGYIVLVGVFRLEPLTKKQVSSIQQWSNATLEWWYVIICLMCGKSALNALILGWRPELSKPRSVPSHWWMPQELGLRCSWCKHGGVELIASCFTRIMPCRASGDIRGHSWSGLPNCHQLPIYPSWVRH